MLDGIIKSLNLLLLRNIVPWKLGLKDLYKFHQTHEITYKLQLGLIAPSASSYNAEHSCKLLLERNKS